MPLEKLREYKSQGEKFDVIVLDPPAFAKSSDSVVGALKGYKDINVLALKLINDGGYLITCSCSQHLSVTSFLNMVEESVKESKVKAKIVEFRTQGKDHAPLIGVETGLYLKVAVLKIMK